MIEGPDVSHLSLLTAHSDDQPCLDINLEDPSSEEAQRAAGGDSAPDAAIRVEECAVEVARKPEADPLTWEVLGPETENEREVDDIPR